MSAKGRCGGRTPTFAVGFAFGLAAMFAAMTWETTRKRVAFTGINIYTIKRGKIVASHVNWNTLGILQQIGTVRLRLRVPASPSRAYSAR